MLGSDWIGLGGQDSRACGWQAASRVLEQAGFEDVTVIAAPAGDPMNAIFIGRT